MSAYGTKDAPSAPKAPGCPGFSMRDLLAAGGPGAAAAIDAVGLIQLLNENLVYNPAEQLQLQALLVALGRLEGMRAATG